RHVSWAQREVLDLLAELDVCVCNIDQPLSHRSIRPRQPGHLGDTIHPAATVETTATGFRRLSPPTSVTITCTPSMSWSRGWTASETVAGKTRDTYAVTNNNHLGKAMVKITRSRRHSRGHDNGMAEGKLKASFIEPMLLMRSNELPD